jgi:hypothetical protein
MQAAGLQLRKYSQPIQNDVAVLKPLSLGGTRWLFFALNFYMLSQAYLIPILTLGPWAIWPTFADFAVGLLALTFLLSWRHALAPSAANKKILHLLLLSYGGCLLSFLTYFAFSGREMGTNDGAYYLYRLTQFLCIFWITTRIPLTLERIRIMRWVVDLVLIVVCTTVTLTYFEVIPINTLAPQLPSNPTVAGPWYRYAAVEFDAGESKTRGWGTVGYDHIYVALQILMLISLRMHLGLNRMVFSENLLLLFAGLGIFFSESRGGLAALVVFVALYWLKKPGYIVVTLFFVATLGSAALFLFRSGNINWDITVLESTLQRQETITAAPDLENLSGRDRIWADRIALLDEAPLRWLIGVGFGAGRDTGNKAHSVYLQVIVETGLIGFFIFCLLFYKILSYLRRYEGELRPIFGVTIALLISAIVQDTFYPVPNLGHLTGFYLCTLAIALRLPGNEEMKVIADTAEPISE